MTNWVACIHGFAKRMGSYAQQSERSDERSDDGGGGRAAMGMSQPRDIRGGEECGAERSTKWEGHWRARECDGVIIARGDPGRYGQPTSQTRRGAERRRRGETQSGDSR